MAIKHASWTHGSGVQIENPENLKQVTRYAFFTKLVGKPGTGTWVHFAVPTPVIVDNQRLKLESAMIRVRCNSTKVCVANFHVCDGEDRFFVKDRLNLAVLDWQSPLHRELIRPERPVLWGIGVTLYIAFNGTTDAENTIELASAGCDFSN
ncbi:MAG: DUF6623 family protein [Haliscomenobacter sp.]|uniref:DUF6623 family protein n=1 Tax=Haliscomenobacter sp. TaxID=2717303 RepID=UPI0029A53726|nr:DUF6623 family protein [Haliscomenobacter sp.]MDX2072069.1 DUF6623 family protein [Haliscomenobacter sp.]